jgi:hypothetical protein
MRSVDDAEHFEIISKDYKFGVIYGVTNVINEYIKKKGPQDKALRHTGSYSKRQGESTRHTDS